MEITAQLYADGRSLYPLNNIVSLVANPNHTFSIINSKNNYKYFDIEPYMLRGVWADEDSTVVNLEYVDRIEKLIM